MAINYIEAIVPCLEIVFFFPEVNITPEAMGLHVLYFVFPGLWQDFDKTDYQKSGRL